MSRARKAAHVLLHASFAGRSGGLGAPPAPRASSGRRRRRARGQRWQRRGEKAVNFSYPSQTWLVSIKFPAHLYPPLPMSDKAIWTRFSGTPSSPSSGALRAAAITVSATPDTNLSPQTCLSSGAEAFLLLTEADGVADQHVEAMKAALGGWGWMITSTQSAYRFR
jgi:hypothetical protein